MNYDLIERYIYAATKRLSRKQRDDVAQELRGLIDDMLNERCGEVTPTEKDIRVVLTELGTPQELSAQYDEDAKKCLIGQPYYSTYKFVLKIVLLAAAGGITIANLMLQMVEPQEWFAAITGWLVMVYNCLLAAFTIVTLLFAFFYHKGVQITEPFNFDNLPPVPKRTQEITKWECIAGIVFCVLFAVLFLVVPQILGIIIDVNGQKISLFEVSALQGPWYIILAIDIYDDTQNLRDHQKYDSKKYAENDTRNALPLGNLLDFLGNGRKVIKVEWLRYADSLVIEKSK